MTLNNDAIRRSLKRSDIFVVFGSKNSINSSFVLEEERTAFELRGRGSIKSVLIFVIDDISYKELPEWLRDINIVSKVSSPAVCARKIQSELLKIDSEKRRSDDLYIGRDDDEKSLRQALAVPAQKVPLFLHAVGHPGIGRRTFIFNTLRKYYPRLYDSYVEVSVGRYDGPDALFRQLYGLTSPSTITATLEALDEFAAKDTLEQAETLAAMLAALVANGEIVLVNDDNGVYDEEGDYQPYLKGVLDRLSQFDRPIVGIVQTRMMPAAKRAHYKRSYYRNLRALSDKAVHELLSLKLNQAEIEFTEQEAISITSLLDGHPYDINFVIKYIESYGIKSLLADPSELIAWKRHRAEDFLSRLNFSDDQTELISIISSYRYVSIELLLHLSEQEQFVMAGNLRVLEDYCCIERKDDYYYIPSTIIEGIRRLAIFDRTDEWRKNIGSKMCDIVSNYKGDDSISISILETAVDASIRGARFPAFLENLVLPSHLLQIAREFYDKRKYGSSAEFCKRAWDMHQRLPADAQVEALRIWGLSSARLKDRESFHNCLRLLGNYDSRFSMRVLHFLKGFEFRLNGKAEDAEREFLAAYRLAQNNQSINRELASLYCKEKRYGDAENHARLAFKQEATNPFILDIMAETLLGKQEIGLPVDKDELKHVLSELRIHGDAPGSSFHLVREGQRALKERSYKDAIDFLGKAISRTSTLPTPYLLRANAYLKIGKPTEAENDLKSVGKLLDDTGHFSSEYEPEIQEIEAKILIERSQFKSAKDKIEKSAFLSSRTTARLLTLLSRAVAHAPAAADASMREWAKRFSAGRS